MPNENKPFLALLAALLFLAGSGYSQSDFRKGYVVTDADTLFGFVDYREGTKAHKSCEFKRSEGADAVTYQPGEIYGYGFENDKFFQSREISMKGQDPQVVFLEVLVKGRVSLYEFGGNFFVGKNDEGLRHLTNEKEVVVMDGTRVFRNSNQYIGEITMLVFDCHEIREKVQNSKLSERSLTGLIEDYNECIGEPATTFKANKSWTKVKIGMTAGLNVSRLSFSTTKFHPHLAADFEPSYSPMIGASFEISSPRISERISLHADGLYLASKYRNHTLTDRVYSEKRDYVTIELIKFKIPIGIRYTFPERKITPFINIGISNTFNLNADSRWREEIESKSNDVTIINEDDALEIKNRPFGFWGGFGMIKSISNKLNASIEIRYEQTDGITPYSVDALSLESKITNFQILIGIKTK